MSRKRSWLAAGSLALVALFLTALPGAASASYVFEPVHSLTGDCSASARDEVPDPGPCPIPPGTVYPEPEADHPSTGFKSPAVAIDEYGDIYVASVTEKEGRIDVFSPKGFFITEFLDPAGPQSIAVDSKGNVYLFERISGGERQVRRFPPTLYDPLKEEIKYAAEPQVIANESTKPVLSVLGPDSSLAVDASLDQLYVDTTVNVAVFGAASEGNELLEKEAITGLTHSSSITIDGQHEKIYLSDKPETKSVIRVFELKSPHEELGQIDGSSTPKGEFLSPGGFLGVALDDQTGHVFVGDVFSAHKVYEFEEDGTYLATMDHSFNASAMPGLAVDDGAFSPHTEKEAWLFVPSDTSPTLGHVYAFDPKEQCVPVVESTFVTGITETDAVLHARINPCGLETNYRLEYVTQQQFEEEGGKSFEEGNATTIGEGVLPKGAEGVPVSAAFEELAPGTAYRYRVFAQNEKGTAESQRHFSTFEEVEPFRSCPNDTLRTGSSVSLPDCRAYEIVTPPATNGFPPSGGLGSGIVRFPMLQSSPEGSRVSFAIEGGTIGSGGAGALNGDLYLASRGYEGWVSRNAGPSGEEEINPLPGSTSPDQTYSLWLGSGGAVYIHFPDGHSELVGKGGLGEDATVTIDLITAGAFHIVFEADEELEPNAPPQGTTALYDRSATGASHVVSLLPGDQPQKAGESAKYLGASEDGEGIVFSIGGTIYVRLRNAETLEVAGSGAKFAGVAEQGKRVFYTEGGDLFAFDTAKEETVAFSESGDVIPVNVSTGGTRAYFVSPSVLTGAPNPNVEEAKPGAENLYLSEGEGQLSFVARVTKRDVEGEGSSSGQVEGLGLWEEALQRGQPPIDPSRTTPEGATFLFESRANLTNFESEGLTQVYRYDADQGRLDCLSCSLIDASPSRGASLQSVPKSGQFLVPLNTSARIPNQSPDGKRAFFQTAEPLVPSDTDGKLDVYEWEAKDTGSCHVEGGCTYLISGGQSASDDYLYAMSESGGDVFFRTADLLVPRDAEDTLSLYDARIDGGFAEPIPNPPCVGESCHPVGVTPSLPGPTTSIAGPSRNVPRLHQCPKRKRKVKRRGKDICVKRHNKHHRRRSGGTRKRDVQ